MSLNYDLVCTQCGYELATGLRPGHVHPDEGRRLTQALLRGCPACDENGVKANFSVRLDLSQIQPPGRPGAARLVDPGAPGIWRWRTLLPVDPRVQVSLGEGDTPLLRLQRFGRRIGVKNLYVKDESRNPTWSYKDRLCAAAISNALEFGAEVVTVSSTGNHGAATAAYAARAGLPCVVFTLASAPDVMKTLMQAYGARVVALEVPQDRWRLMKAMSEQHGWYAVSGFQSPPLGSNPFGIEGYKTIAFEIWEKTSDAWRQRGGAPDWVVVPTAHGDGLTGIWKGWRELHELGCVEKVPKMVAAELNPSLSPALERNEASPVPAASTAPADAPAFSINVATGTQQTLAAIRRSGGRAVCVQDADLVALQLQLARDEGIYAETSSVAALAAVQRLAAQGAVAEDDVVVAVITSSALKDPGATAARLPAVPVIAPDVAHVPRPQPRRPAT